MCRCDSCEYMRFLTGYGNIGHGEEEYMDKLMLLGAYLDKIASDDLKEFGVTLPVGTVV